MRRPALALALALLTTLGACDDKTDTHTVIEVPDAAEDAGADGAPPADARPDAAPPVDAEPPRDGAPPVDAAPLDAGDAAPPDAGADAAAPTPACANGADDDGDEQIDYPLDPGCADMADDDEADPAAPACADGEDNDGDERVDLDDPGCAGEADPSEADACGEVQSFRDVSNLGHVEGDTTDLPAVFGASCKSNEAPEAVFLFTVRDPRVTALAIDTAGSAFDTVLSVRRICADPLTEVACDDDSDNTPGVRSSRLRVTDVALGDYFIIVDGFRQAHGRFMLNVRAELPDGEACPSPADAGPLGCGAGSICVDGICAPAACSDGEDNDADAWIDFPQDPGCQAPEDDDETDPDPLPECADGQDNDFDGRIDYPEDPNCLFAGDGSEAPPPACSDGLDNDDDTLVDLDDPGCQSPDDPSEFNIEACRDGQDNDDDGHVDYPSDPGCLTPTDPFEEDPEAPPECADGVDNDGDGATDFPDDADGCQFAADGTEGDPCPELEPEEITGLANVHGRTDGAPNELGASCEALTGPEQVYIWRVAEDRPLEALRLNTIGSRIDGLINVRDRCAAPFEEELGCDDDSAPSGQAFVELGPQAVGTELWIIVQGGNALAEGVFRLQIAALLAAGANCAGGGAWSCGDGLACHDAGEGSRRCERSICNDGDDNDGDGRADYPLDPGCASASDDDERDPDVPPQCDNGVDDDGDGAIDFGDDPGCDGAGDDFEGPDCADRIDNDGDGGADFDRDGNGFRDQNADPGCACDTDPSERVDPPCSDGCDNDRDGLIDLEDPGCVDDPAGDSEFNFPQCQDGVDNDGDGFIDFPDDPGCATNNDSLERNPESPPECSDGQDNDGDGRADFDREHLGRGDPDCLSAADDTEGGACDRPQTPLPDSGEAAGNTNDESNDHVGSCRPGNAPEAVFVASVPYPAQVHVDTFGSVYDTVLFVRSACLPTTVCPLEPPEPGDAGMADAGAPDLGVRDAGPADGAAPDGEAADGGLADDAAPDGEAADAGLADDAAPDGETADAALDATAPDADLDAARPDAGALEAGLADADLADAGEPTDVGPPPCMAESTEIDCNDDANGLQSAVDIQWAGGDLYLFVDGFGASAGLYELHMQATYPPGGRCGPEAHSYAICAPGTDCLPDPEAAFSTCQAAR